MIVADNMTLDPVIVAPDVATGTALQLMDDCAIRHLPVMHRGRMIGLVSDRDLLGATAWRVVGSGTRQHKTVRQVMHREVVSVTPDDQIVSALVEVVVGGIGCLPVLERGRLIGIVTETDLLSLYTRLCREAPQDEGVDPRVAAVAHADAITVSPEATAEEADELCHHKGFRHLPVVRDGELIGVLSDRDLRRRVGAGIDPGTPVEALMTRDVRTTHPDEPLSEAAGRMIEHKISSLPVVDGPRLGILTSLDVLDHGTGVIRDFARTGEGARADLPD